MKALRIPFKGPMVRSILKGIKTQTRRLIVQPTQDKGAADSWIWHGGKPLVDAGYGDRYVHTGREAMVRAMLKVDPHQQGRELLVSEAWRVGKGYDDVPPRELPQEAGKTYLKLWFDADGAPPDWAGKLRPPMFMPLWACRIKLMVVSVRIERLQEITAADAIAEGLTALTKDGGRTTKYGIPDLDGWPGDDDDGWPWKYWRISPIDAYQALWERMHPGTWKDNPFVRVTTFRQIVL